jgi:hypothetical protein
MAAPKGSVLALRMIFILVLAFSFIVFILTVTMLLRLERIIRIILVRVPGYDNTKIVLFLRQGFFELTPIGRNSSIRQR